MLQSWFGHFGEERKNLSFLPGIEEQFSVIQLVT
jgi:hypothetical protein